MLARQALWVPVVKHCPSFVESFHRFLRDNPITSLSVAAVGLKPEEAQVALEPDTRDPERLVAAMMAFPVQISAAACDFALDAPPQRPRELSAGFATSLCDSCNSFQVMQRLLPAFSAHVSVNLESQCLRTLREGEKVVVVSTIDKMGKRLVYCGTDFYVEPTAPVAAEVVERERNLKTLADLRAALTYYEKAVSGAHVKSIVSERKTK